MADELYFADLNPIVTIDPDWIIAAETDPVTPARGYKIKLSELKAFVSTDTITEVLTVSTPGQTAFTLGSTPSSPSESILVLNGQIRLYTTDFTISGTALTWNDPGTPALTLKTTDRLQIWYNLDLGAPMAAVTSFNTRVGAVTSQAGDYTVGQVTGAAVSGANSDITSLTGLTTPLSIAQGGTNSAVALTNGKLMISSGSAVIEGPATSVIPTNINAYFPVEPNANQGNHRTRIIGATGSFNYEFAVPDDFNALVSLELIISPRTGAGGSSKDVDLSSSYGTFGDVINVHSETDSTTTYDFGNVGEFKAVSIASVFTSLAAGDICGVNWDNNSVGGTIDTYFIKLVYTR